MTTKTIGPQTKIDAWVDRLRNAARTGVPIDLAPAVPDAVIGRYWLVMRGKSAEIPAEAIRRALLDPDLRADPQGLQIRGAYIPEILDLDYATISTRLAINFSRFGAAPTFRQTSLSVIDFSGSLLPGVRFDFADVSGNVTFLGSHLNGEFRASNAKVGGRLVLSRTDFNGVGGRALNLDLARVQGDVLLDDVVTDGEMRAEGTQVGGRFVLSGAKLYSEKGSALVLDSAKIRGAALIGERLTARGEIHAHGIEIAGQLVMNGSSLVSDGGLALGLDKAVIGGHVVLDDVVVTGGTVRAIGSQIGGQLLMRGVHFINSNEMTLSLEGAIISGDVVLKRGVHSEGEISCHGCSIGGQLVISGATLVNHRGLALDLSYAKIAGAVFINQQTRITGEVSAHGAVFGGQLNFKDMSVERRGGVALDLDYVQVAASLFLSDGCTIDGEVRAVGARVDGQFSLKKGTVKNPEEVALRLTNAKFANLVLAESQIEGKTILAYSRIQTLVTAKEKPNESVGLPELQSAQGWKVEAIHGFLRHDRRAIRCWLDTVPRVRDEFISQPWTEAATVFESMGQSGDGRWLRYQAARRETRISSWWIKPFHWLYRWTVGYGYHPLRPFYWMAAAVALAYMLALGHAESFTPTNREVAKIEVLDGQGQLKPVSGATMDQPVSYPKFNPLLYALDTALPAVDTGQAKSWQVTNTVWLPVTLATLKCFSWLLAALLLAGLTGILRRS
jgi:hypothetical protein